MRRFIIKTVIIHIIILLAGQPLLAAEAEIDWFRDFYLATKPSFDLKYEAIALPEDDGGLSEFSFKARNELLNLTNLYGSGNTGEAGRGSLGGETPQVNLSLNEERQRADLAAPGVITFNPLPGLLVSADYDQKLEELKAEKKTNIRLNYQMNQRTMIRAEFGLGQKEWWGVQEINLDGEEGRLPGESQDNSDLPTFDEDNTRLREAVFNTEDTKESRVGVSYQTSDRITLTADYIDQVLNNESDFSTVFGVQYNDERGQVRYSYQIDYGESRQTVSGLELDLKELATFNASYKLLNPDLLKDQLKESIWDFGIDVSLSNISSLSLGYQLKSEQESIDEIGLDSDLESNIRAKLEFSF